MDHREQTSFTITTKRGSYSFSLHRSAMVFTGFLGLLFLSAFVGAFVIIYTLKAEFTGLKAKRSEEVETLSVLERRNLELQTEISQKNAAVERLRHFEKILSGRTPDFQKASAESDAQRLERTEETLIQRRTLLTILPSGSPLQLLRAYVTSPFGYRIHPVTHQRVLHTGIDLSAPYGTPIYATAIGVVRRAGPMNGYGKLVIVDHSLGFTTYYAHLSAILVTPGEIVKKGEVIGYSGNSGVTTGPHLHYEVRYANKPLDPASFIAWSLRSYEVVLKTQSEIPWKKLLDTLSSDTPPAHPL